MSRWHAGLAVTVGCLALVFLAGCPLDSVLPGPESDQNADTPVDDEGVFKLLAADAEALEPDEQDTSDDEQAFFGEGAGQYDPAAGDPAEVTEETILAEAGVEDGRPLPPHGRLVGRFHLVSPGQVQEDVAKEDDGDVGGDTDHGVKRVGVLRGRWFSANEELAGVFRGRYRPASPDHLPAGIVAGGTFRAKYVDRDGRFRGFMRGKYGRSENGRSLFYGYWRDRHHRIVGVLKGHWDEEPDTNGGTMAGRWIAFNVCDEADSLPDVDISEEDLSDLEAPVSEDIPAKAGDPEQGEPLDAEIDLHLADVPPCIDPGRPFGFLRGWHRPLLSDAPADVGKGILRGHWRGVRGLVAGTLLGRYKQLPHVADDPAAEVVGPHVIGVFAGRYVNYSGEIRGHIRGQYGVSVHGVGVFRGKYYNADDEEMGVIRGRWANHPHRPGGPFFGVWHGLELYDSPGDDLADDAANADGDDGDLDDDDGEGDE